jgi:hypothetical protein
MKIFTAALLISGVSLAWCADNGGIGGPVTGFVVDGHIHSIRPINGIPGAAQLGGAVQLPFAVGLAAISTTQDYALVTAFRKGGSPVLARGLRSGAPQTSAIDGAIAASGMMLAASGTTAAVYSNGAGKLQFITGLPASPVAHDPVDISTLNGGVAAMAVDTAGVNALLVAGDGNIYWAAGQGARGLNWVARVPGASSASLLPSGDDAVVGSAETGDVILLHGLNGSLTIRKMAGASNGINSARALQAISDREIGVVDGDGRLGTIDVESGTTAWIALAGAAEGFESLGSNLLLLNHAGPAPLLLFDMAQGHATYFVPPDGNTGIHRK